MRKSLALVAIGVVLAGCAEETQTAVEFDRPVVYQSVVALSPESAELVHKVSGMPVLTGRTAESTFPTGVARASVIMTDGELDMDALLELEPDLIVYSPGDVPQDVIDGLDADTFVYDPADKDELFDAIFRLGSKLRGEMRASEYVDDIRRELEVGAAIPEDAKPRTMMIDAAEDGSFLAAGTTSIEAMLAGGIGADIVGPEGDDWLPVSPEYIAAMAPELLLADGEAVAQALLSDALVAGVPAITNQHIYIVQEDRMTRAGSEIDDWLKRTIELTQRAGGA